MAHGETGFTNKGKIALLTSLFQGATSPTNFYAYLVTNDVVPTADTNTLSNLVIIPQTGKQIALTPNSTDFDHPIEDDTNDKASIQIKNLNFAGAITDASYVVLTDDDATEADRIVYAYWDFGSVRETAVSTNLVVADLQFNLLE